MFEIQKRESNGDATLYYMNIIKKAAIRAGEIANDGYDYSQTKGKDVVTLNPASFYRALKKGAKTASVWFQGVDGIEYLHYGRCRWFKRIERYLVLSFYEWYALKNSSLNFFVSKRMLEYYKKTFGYKKTNYVIMPCFNDQMKEESFYDEKYKKPTFVYAGNLAKWQCFPQMIDLFKRIQKELPNAELTIYTPDQEEAKQVLKEKAVKALVKYVPYSQLAEEIKRFKYGFLIRDDDTVNNVATPTKMCNYLANGIIPIFSNVIGDFTEELSSIKYSIPLGDNSEGIEKLFELEQLDIPADDVRADYSRIFENYYSEEYYVRLISEKIKQYILRSE